MTSEQWQQDGRETWLDLPTVRLVAFPDYEARYGFRWSVIPKVNGLLVCRAACCSIDVTGETEPYRTQQDAITAVTNYYTRTNP